MEVDNFMENTGCFLRIAITLPEFFPGEAERITRLIDNREADLVHIRKPDSGLKDMTDLLEKIPSRIYNKLKLHDHFELIDKYDLGGVHLNGRNPHRPENMKAVSKSIHSLEELKEYSNYDYLTLSPIFDSISKPGYTSRFILKELKDRITGKRIVALGGVTPSKFELLKNTGFIGAAMLGYYWKMK